MTEGLESMRLYVFKSGAKRELRAFAGDAAGSKLPTRHGPWTAVGVVRPDKNPPHGLPRETIEQAIHDAGFQLWRLREGAKA